MTMERDSLVARLEPCPFERGTCDPDCLVVEVADDPAGRKGIKQGRVCCSDCGAKGPVCYAHKDEIRSLATYSWNDRAAALSRPEQVVIPASERPTSDALIEKYASSMYGRIVGVPDSVIRQQFSEFAQELAMLASAPASPAIGVQAVTDEMVERAKQAVWNTDAPEYQRDYLQYDNIMRAALEAALHPAPEAASAGGAGVVEAGND